ncbi:uncharacterized protein PAC_19171 [Phialocephala subalpina]|uniref:Uncharacterized protein n=1 Tax=Phialocephala subalpina TaxID=576137 RepID=A0A1L7XW58_9HELO|nr:uncharacterized protein PAC_19171 [Phialocephala subalpina]
MPRNPDSDHIDRMSNPSSGSLLANVDGDLQGFESEKNTTGIGNEEYLAGRRSLSGSAEFSRNGISNQKKVPEWAYELSLNTVVSVLTTLTELALMKPVSECIGQLKWMWFCGKAKKLVQFGAFDEASRGAWGSFTFFFKLPIFKLAGACALITVIATAASPVTQQVVSYPTLPICVDTAVAARADSYLADSISENPLQISARNDDITASMRDAVNAGLYADSSSPLALLEPQCATRNCTWEIFHSLSVCSQTVDISDHIANTTNEPNLLVRTLPNGVYLSFHRTVGKSLNITTSDHFNGSIAFSSIKEGRRGIHLWRMALAV